MVEQTRQLIVDVLKVILLDIRPIASSHLWFCHKRRHDTQPNDVQHNDTQHDDTQHKGIIYEILYDRHSAKMTLGMPIVCSYAECHYAE